MCCVFRITTQISQGSVAYSILSMDKISHVGNILPDIFVFTFQLVNQICFIFESFGK